MKSNNLPKLTFQHGIVACIHGTIISILTGVLNHENKIAFMLHFLLISSLMLVTVYGVTVHKISFIKPINIKWRFIGDYSQAMFFLITYIGLWVCGAIAITPIVNLETNKTAQIVLLGLFMFHMMFLSFRLFSKHMHQSIYTTILIVSIALLSAYLFNTSLAYAAVILIAALYCWKKYDWIRLQVIENGNGN